MQKNDVRTLALAQFRKDWPLMAHRLDAMRVRAAASGKGAPLAGKAGSGGVSVLSVPVGNHGDNNDGAKQVSSK